MINVGIIGGGRMGHAHATALQCVSDRFNLVGFLDTNKDHSASMLSSFKIYPFQDVDELLSCVDLVVIASPTNTHFDYAVRSIRRSKHLFIEKPVTTSLEEAKSLLSLAREADVTIQIGHLERFNPAFVAVENHLNRPVLIQSRRMIQAQPKSFETAVMDYMLHDIDMVLHLVKNNIKKVSASGYAVTNVYPDVVNARIEFDNGCVADLSTSLVAEKTSIHSTIYQQGGYFDIDFVEKKASAHLNVPLREDLNPQVETNKNGLHFPESALVEEYISLAESINSDIQPRVSLEDGVIALDVAERILDKLKVTYSSPVRNNS